MKIALVILVLIFSVLAKPSVAIVSANDFNYARVVDGNVNLYKFTSSDNSIDNILCLIEKTYFVEIISEGSDDYKVNYNGITGYVKKNDVVPVSGNPTTPYPVNINLVVGSNCNLRKSPTTRSTASNIISTIPKGETNITFIGRVFSEEVIDFGGTTWYYVMYNGEKGYIYNQYLKSASPIYPNTEEVSVFDDTSTSTISPLSNSSSIAIMVLLFIPCVAILFILYVPFPKNHESQEIGRKKSLKGIKHMYY